MLQTDREDPSYPMMMMQVFWLVGVLKREDYLVQDQLATVSVLLEDYLNLDFLPPRVTPRIFCQGAHLLHDHFTDLLPLPLPHASTWRVPQTLLLPDPWQWEMWVAGKSSQRFEDPNKMQRASNIQSRGGRSWLVRWCWDSEILLMNNEASQILQADRR